MKEEHKIQHAMKSIKTGGILLMLLFGFTQAYGFIGGNAAPLQYSVHTYTVVMDDEAYTPVWGVYPGGTLAVDIEDGSAIALTEGTYYTQIGAVGVSGGNTTFTIQFSTVANGPMAVGPYVIGYKETTVDGNACATAVILPIILYGPFDIDVALNDAGDIAVCPDDSGAPKTPGNTASTTTIVYLVNVVFPDIPTYGGYDEGKTWYFDFTFTINGQSSGTDATFVSITADGTGMTVPTSYPAAVGNSSYSSSLTVDPSQVTPVEFTVVYNDVLGVNQDIDFMIANIQGAYQEPDIDEVNGTGGNSLTHTIYNMPAVGDILAWE